MRLVSEGELELAEVMFKHHWHMADREGDVGNRVRRGLIAALNAVLNK